MRLVLFALCAFLSFVSIPAAAQPIEFRHQLPLGADPASISEARKAIASMKSLTPGVGGRVNVTVKIDASGKVTEAEVVSGPGTVCPGVTGYGVQVVRDAAKNAALQVRFAPARVNGTPVASTGWLYIDAPEAKRNEAGSGEEILLSAAPPPSGEKGQEGDMKNISGGVLNGKAVELPRPAYPPAARAVRASGQVSVEVLIYEDGTVFSAEAVSGHPLLLSASKNAACGAKFIPTYLNGSPVKVAGRISFNFVP